MNIKRRGGWFIGELLVVFLGVYLAFSLEQYQESQAAEERKVQFLSALQSDFQSSQESLDEAVPVVTSVVDSLLQEHEAGEMPEIGHMALTIGFRSTAWEAMLQAGGVEILEVDFILEMEDYYSLIEDLDETLLQGRQVSSQMILPRMHEGNQVFYDLGSKKLKPGYGWYLTLFEKARDQLVELRSKNEAILSQINAMLASNS